MVVDKISFCEAESEQTSNSFLSNPDRLTHIVVYALVI